MTRSDDPGGTTGLQTTQNKKHNSLNKLMNSEDHILIAFILALRRSTRSVARAPARRAYVAWL